MTALFLGNCHTYRVFLKEGWVYFGADKPFKRIQWEKCSHLFVEEKGNLVDLSQEVWEKVKGVPTPKFLEWCKKVQETQFSTTQVEYWMSDYDFGDDDERIISNSKHQGTFYWDPSQEVKGPDEWTIPEGTFFGWVGRNPKAEYSDPYEKARGGVPRSDASDLVRDFFLENGEPVKQEDPFETFSKKVGRIKVQYEGVEHTLGVVKRGKILFVDLCKTRGKGWNERTFTPVKSWEVQEFYCSCPEEILEQYEEKAKKAISQALLELTAPPKILPSGAPKPQLKKK